MSNETGKVWLVGAGPGDPELLTLKAARVLATAEALVYDRLVSQAILDLVPHGVTRIDVGKAPGLHHASQAEINDMLVRLARAGHRVVRLKGGDPFVFGRGGEEALHLARHNIPFEIVPGVTAALACTAYAGIPVTQRGVASTVTLLTGHCRANEPLQHDWRSLAATRGTLVVYMGLSQIDRIVGELLAAGLAPDTPAAAIMNGTLPTQQVVVARLADIDRSIRRCAMSSPVLVVIGEVAAMADTLAWFHPESVREQHADEARSANG